MKPFKTYEEQIDILKRKHLLIDDPEYPSMDPKISCIEIKNLSGQSLTFEQYKKIRKLLINNRDDRIKKILETYGYYNIVNQYNKPFLNPDGTYLPDIDFFILFSLHQIDNRIKNIIFYPILQIEQRLKTTIAYEFGKAYGPFEGDSMENYVEPYLNPQNYNSHLLDNSGQPKYLKLISRFQNIYSDSSYPPFKHYKTKHHHIPIWVFINQLTYGELVHFYEVLKIQKNISSQFHLTPSQLRTLILFLRKVRNDCAHSSNFINQRYPKIKNDIPLLIQFKEKFSFQKNSLVPSLFLLLIAFKYLLLEDDFGRALVAIRKNLLKYIFDSYIPYASDFMFAIFQLHNREDAKAKMDFFVNCNA